MRTFQACIPIVLVFALSIPAAAFKQPPLNLGATSFLDGGGAPPGLFLLQYVQFIEGSSAVDDSGDRIPGGARSSALASLTQVFYLTRWKLLGGYLGLDLVVPVAAPGGSGAVGPFPVTANRAGLGDIAVGPALQWNGATLLGRPFRHRFEIYAILPTGRYDKAYAANPGSNLLTLEPYYAFTWLFAEGWETSWRFLYAFHGRNDDTDVRPGQAFHLNFALSKAVLPYFRVGASGYYLQQVTEDKIAGATASGSKERVLGIGPGLVLHTPGTTFILSHPIETAVRNRFRGSRTTLQLLFAF